MSVKQFEKTMPKKTHTSTFTTGTLPKKQRKLVETIAVSSYFGNDAAAFYNEQKVHGGVEIIVNTEITNRFGMVLSIEGLFKADGLSTSERSAQWEDVIEIYVNYIEGVEYEATITHAKNKFYSLDMNPVSGHHYTSAHESDFKYIPVEHQLASAENIKERQSIELGTNPVYLYVIPKEIRNPQTGDVIGGTKRDRVIFHTDQEEYFNPNHINYNPGLFLLAELMNQNPMHLHEDTVYLDTRTRGGGIKTDVSRKEIEKRDNTSLYNWDIGYFDGQAYQENGVFVIQVDANRFKGMADEEIIREKESIEKAVDKYKAFGVLPFVEFKQDVEVEIGELIPNGEFEKGKPCGYFSEGLSSGNWSIPYKELGAGDNFVVQLIDDAKFVIRIPGFNFNQGEKYQFEIKGMKDPNVITMTRSAGKITLKYEDGSEEAYRMNEFTQSYWLSIQQEFYSDEDKTLKEVLIEINDEGQRNGTMYYDYVSLISLGNVIDEQEIVEL